VRATTRWACVLLLGGLLLGGCAGDAAHPGDGPVADPPPVDGIDDGPTRGTAGGDAPVATTTDPPPSLGEDHPLAFSARQLGGGSVDAGELAGGHVVLWLWTPW
jgi:hypothetical protein